MLQPPQGQRCKDWACPTVSLGRRAGGSWVLKKGDRPGLCLLQGFATLQTSFTPLMVSCEYHATSRVPSVSPAWPHIGHRVASPCPGCGLGTLC